MTTRVTLAAFLLMTASAGFAMTQTPDLQEPDSQQEAAPATPAVQTPAPPADAAAVPQTPVPEGKTESGPGQPPEDKRVFGVLPNYRTANGQVPFVPISTKQKFVIATKDSFDYPVLLTSAFFTGLSQLQGKNNDEFGQGVKGFAHRYAIGYVDQVVGNYFPEAIVPAMFHLDPRYFRKGTGSVSSRFFYAVSRIVICKNDNGNPAFNANEFVGNSLAGITTLAYHPHERTWGDAATQTYTYILTDAVGQVMKEFWPDIKRAYGNRHNKSAQ